MYKSATRMAIAKKYNPRDKHKDNTMSDLNENEEEPELLALVPDREETTDEHLLQPSRHRSYKSGHVKTPDISVGVRQVKSDTTIRSVSPKLGSYTDLAAIHIPTATKEEEEEEEKVVVEESSKQRQMREIGERLHAGRRPHTAHVTFQDTKESYDDIIRKYRSCPTTPSELYVQRGTWFEDYQERLIERHQMLKEQRQQRLESAKEKRRLLELRQTERRRALLGHNECGQYQSDATADRVGMITQSDSSLNSLRRRAHSASSVGNMRRGSTVVNRSLGRPKSAFAKFKEQEDLAADKPFRVRLNNQPVKPKVNHTEVFENRTEGKPLLLKRAGPTKSVPGRCRRYVLVSHQPPQPPLPKPTSLEEQLLPDRFPNDMRRWNEFEDYIKSQDSIDPNVMFANVDDFMNSAWK
ncbi:uncharacterized protein LOC144449513 [Glandiceps talaboti]